MNHSSPCSKAFTLVEIMVSVAIMSLVIGMIMISYTTVLKFVRFNTMLNFSHEHVRKASDRIAMEIRQAVTFPLVYDSEGNRVNPGVPGQEIKIMKSGIYTHTASFTTSSSPTIVLLSPSTGVNSIQYSLVTGVLPTNLNTVAGQPVMQQPPSTTVSTNEFMQIDNSTLDTLLITGVTTNSSEITLTIADNLVSPVGAGTRVTVGKMSSYKAVNYYTNYATAESRALSAGAADGFSISGELLYYPDDSNTNEFSVIVKNLNTTNPFTANSSYYTIDIRFTSRGDVTGKGIYRILTHATMRSNPAYLYTSKASVGGIHGEPSGGVYDQ